MLSMDDFTHVSDARIRAVLGHWLEIRRGRRIPARRDLDPAGFRGSLPYVWLCDHVQEVDGFRFRLAGEEVNALHGTNLAGVDLAQVLPQEAVAEVVNRYRRLVRDPMIVHMIGKMQLPDGRLLEGERIVLPLGAGEDGTVDTLLGAVVYDRRSFGPGSLHREALARTMTPLAGAA